MKYVMDTPVKVWSALAVLAGTVFLFLLLKSLGNPKAENET